MFEALNPLYLWIKAFHIIAVIAWMAGMLYLPRLYVYHCEVAPGSAAAARFKIMERRLLRVIVPGRRWWNDIDEHPTGTFPLYTAICGFGWGR